MATRYSSRLQDKCKASEGASAETGSKHGVIINIAVALGSKGVCAEVTMSNLVLLCVAIAVSSLPRFEGGRVAQTR